MKKKKKRETLQQLQQSFARSHVCCSFNTELSSSSGPQTLLTPTGCQLILPPSPISPPPPSAPSHPHRRQLAQLRLVPSR